MSSEDDSCTSQGSGSASTMDLLHDSSPASLPHSQPSVLSSQTHPSLHHHQSSAFHHQLSNSALKVSSNTSAYKVKRTRQRVDAGEPRNSYASITNFSSQRFSTSNNSFHGNHQTSPTAAYHQFNGIIAPQANNNKLVHHSKTSNASGDSNNNTGGFKSNYSLANAASAVSTTNADREMILFDESIMTQWVATTAPSAQVSAYVNGNGAGNANNGGNHLENGDHSASPAKDAKEKTRDSSNESSAHLLRDILQTGRNVSQHCKSGVVNEQRDSDAKVGGNVSHCSDASEGEEEDLNEEDTSRECSEQETANMNDDKPTADKLGVTGECASSASRCSSPQQASAANKQCNNGNKQQQHVNSSTASNGNSNISEVKRARVENIVSNMLLGNCSTGAILSNGSPENANKVDNVPVNGCKKRKLYQPQQSKLNSEEDEEYEEEDLPRLNDDEEGNEDEFDEIDLSTKKTKIDEKSEDKDSLQQQLQTLQSQLFAMKHQYVQLFEQQQQQHRMQQLASRSMATPFQSPVNLTTSVSPLREEDDLEENLSEKAQTPISQLSDRETPANNASLTMPNSIQDPAQFLDEARRILSEQERIGKRNVSSTQPVPSVGVGDIECLCESLKAEIQSNIFPSILQVIDATVSRYFHRRDHSSKRATSAEPANKDLTILSQMLESKSPRTAGKVSDRSSNMASQKSVNGASRVSPFTLPTESAPAPKPSGPSPFAFPPSNFKSPFFLPNIGHGGSQTPNAGLIPPTLAHHFNTIASAFHNSRETVAANANRDLITVKSNGTHSSVKESHRESREPAPEQTEAMSLVVAPKRKRHKVTDTRITPRTVSRILGQEPLMSIGRDFGAGSPPHQPLFSHHGPSAPPPPLVPVSLPTSVAIPNPSLHQTELFSGTPFAFPDPARFGFYTSQLAVDSQEDCDDKDNGKNNAAAVSAAAISSVMAAHHLSMLAQANRGSPDSVQGYQTGGIRTGVGSDSGNNDGSELSFNESSQFDGNMPMISFSIHSAQHITTKT